MGFVIDRSWRNHGLGGRIDIYYLRQAYSTGDRTN
jgi:hypothetical protein